MRRWWEDSNDSRAFGAFKGVKIVYSLINDIVRWLWSALKHLAHSPGPLAHDLARLRTKFRSRDELRASLAEAQRRSKPLLLVYINPTVRLSDARERLIEEFSAAQSRLCDDYELFFCAPGAYSFSAQLIAHVVGEYSFTQDILCKCVCLIPYAFNATLMHRGRSHLTNLVDSISGIPLDEQRSLMAEILQANLFPLSCPDGAVLNMKPSILPQSTIISAFNLRVAEQCDPIALISLLVDLAEHSHSLIAPIVSYQSERQASIKEARRLREIQDQEYQTALRMDQERARQREAEKARELELANRAEEERREAASREAARKGNAIRMVSLARKMDLDKNTSGFFRVCIRIHGAKLLCYCHPHAAVRSLESAIKNLDLIFQEADPAVRHPVLIVGQEMLDESSPCAPAMIIDGGSSGWLAKPCGPFTDEYGLISAFPSQQQILRDRSLLQNGIESNSSILWDKLPLSVNH